MRRALILLAVLSLSACSPEDDVQTLENRLVKSETLKTTVMGSYRDGSAIVVVVEHFNEPFSANWVRWKCYPPAGSGRWFCEKIGDPNSMRFLEK